MRDISENSPMISITNFGVQSGVISASERKAFLIIKDKLLEIALVKMRVYVLRSIG